MHLSTEDIVSYLHDMAADAEKSSLEAHLAVCAACAESKREIETLQTWLREEPLFEPPAHLVDRWINAFTSAPRPEKPSLRQIIASLVFDSLDQSLFAFERGQETPARQRLFRAEDIDVDVKVESNQAGEQISLNGQVLVVFLGFLYDAPVCLESYGGARYQTRTNQVGEFSFEVPDDTYRLSIDLQETQIKILDVYRPGSNTKERF